jgi:hypothetical protein
MYTTFRESIKKYDRGPAGDKYNKIIITSLVG